MVFSNWYLLASFLVGFGCSWWFRQSSKNNKVKISQAKREGISLSFNFMLALVTISLALFIASLEGEKLTTADTKLMFDMARLFAVAATVVLGVIFGEIVWVVWDSRHKHKEDKQNITISMKDIECASKQQEDFKTILASLAKYFNESKDDDKPAKGTKDEEDGNAKP